MQCIVNRSHQERAKPLIDFYFNGRVNLGVELVLNENAGGVQEHLQRFDDKYIRFKDNGVVFHIQTKKEEPVLDMKPPYDTEMAKNRVYTFVKKRNALYQGSNLVQSNVVRCLPSPPVKTASYSTTVARYVCKKVLKLLY